MHQVLTDKHQVDLYTWTVGTKKYHRVCPTMSYSILFHAIRHRGMYSLVRYQSTVVKQDSSVEVHHGMYAYVRVCTCTYATGQVRTGMYEYVLDPIFKGNQNYNTFRSEDKYLLCADGQVHSSMYQYILVRTSTF